MQPELFLAAPAAASGISSIILIVVMVGVFYFLIMRPQNKEQKRKQQMLNDMVVGDTVLTSSGFYGVVIDIQEDTVIVEFGSNRNCRIPMQKAAILATEKPEDAVADKEDKKDDKKEA